jgi:hypothetical protein
MECSEQEMNDAIIVNASDFSGRLGFVMPFLKLVRFKVSGNMIIIPTNCRFAQKTPEAQIIEVVLKSLRNEYKYLMIANQ